ncbi:MAG: hypothetical protein RMM28_00060 [Thermoleophilia bacterium]|nr:hypothetical protein [Gaiellaceae bacterium]MDW8337522.1 hypothetical protein [Thermoleophilia bacterium]
MRGRRWWEVGGLLAGAALVVFGVIAIAMGASGFTTVRDSIEQEGIVFGPAEDPAVAEHAAQWAGQPVETGEQARAFALVIREHALEASGGLTYAQMGRFAAADDPESLEGTNDPEAALKDEEGKPVPNPARSTWVTATALSTALNMSYLAERLAVFGIVVGIALLLTGVGLVILAFAVFGRRGSLGRAATA